MSNTKNNFSIIIPTYNEEKSLPGCLESISLIDYPKNAFEVILVDNGSTDKTRLIAEGSGAKVLCDDSKTVAGLRNLGAAYAKSDVLSFLDADCIVSTEWLKQASLYLDKKEVVVWGAPPTIPFDATWVQKTWFLIRKRRNMIEYVKWLESMNMFVRKHHFLKCQGFNENLITCEDVDFCYRISNQGMILSDSRIIAVHLGEAKTLKAFFQKEIWRGNSNFQGILSHGIKINELPSLIIPIYFAIFVPFMIGWALLSLDLWIVAAAIFMYLLPVAALLFKAKGKRPTFIDLMRLFVLVQVYFWARTVAVVIRRDIKAR